MPHCFGVFTLDLLAGKVLLLEFADFGKPDELVEIPDRVPGENETKYSAAVLETAGETPGRWVISRKARPTPFNELAFIQGGQVSSAKRLK
jgi:hypothetical protein